MNNEKIIKAENENEIVRIFRELTMSGAISGDVAITKIMRDFPHLFRQPSENEVKRNFNDAMNSELRARALQPTSRPTYDIFRRPADKQKTR
jgi:hypothetical protein